MSDERRRSPRPSGESWIAADAVRARLQHWRDAGIGVDRAAVLTGLAVSTLQAIRAGQPRVHPSTARAILSARGSLADGALVPVQASYETRERLRRLLEDDFPAALLVQLCGRRALEVLARPDKARHAGSRVRVRTWRRVAQVQARLDWGATG